MNDTAKHIPIPLPDAEVIERCTIARACTVFEMQAGTRSGFTCIARARIDRWIRVFTAMGCDLLVFGWPDGTLCYAVTPLTATGAPAMFAPPAILSAYRHGLSDPQGYWLFFPFGEHIIREAN